MRFAISKTKKSFFITDPIITPKRILLFSIGFSTQIDVISLCSDNELKFTAIYSEYSVNNNLSRLEEMVSFTFRVKKYLFSTALCGNL
jgi:hypothetical protein